MKQRGVPDRRPSLFLPCGFSVRTVSERRGGNIRKEERLFSPLFRELFEFLMGRSSVSAARTDPVLRPAGRKPCAYSPLSSEAAGRRSPVKSMLNGFPSGSTTLARIVKLSGPFFLKKIVPSCNARNCE